MSMSNHEKKKLFRERFVEHDLSKEIVSFLRLVYNFESEH